MKTENTAGAPAPARTAAGPPPILRRLLSKLAVCDDCKVCWPVAHIDPRTDARAPHEYGHLVHLWLELHLFCGSVRFAAADQVRGAAYEPMEASGDVSRTVERLQAEFERRAACRSAP